MDSKYVSPNRRSLEALVVWECPYAPKPVLWGTEVRSVTRCSGPTFRERQSDVVHCNMCFELLNSAVQLPSALVHLPAPQRRQRKREMGILQLGLRAMQSRLCTIVIFVAVVSVACAQSNPADTTEAASAPTPAPSPTPSAPMSEGGRTSAPTGSTGNPKLDEQINWVVGLLNGETATKDQIAARFTKKGRKNVSPQEPTFRCGGPSRRKEERNGALSRWRVTMPLARFELASSAGLDLENAHSDRFKRGHQEPAHQSRQTYRIPHAPLKVLSNNSMSLAMSPCWPPMYPRGLASQYLQLIRMCPNQLDLPSNCTS